MVLVATRAFAYQDTLAIVVRLVGILFLSLWLKVDLTTREC